MDTESQQNEFQDVEIVTIPTSDGDVDYAILDYFDYQGKKYVITSPIEEDVIQAEVEIFRYRQDGEKVTLDVVDDRKQFNQIAEAYNQQL